MSTRALAVVTAAVVAVVALAACGETSPPKDTTASAHARPIEPPGMTSAVDAGLPDAAAPAAPPAQPMACEGTTLRAGAKQYCLMTSRRTFEQAAGECERMHARLAVLADAEETGAITAQLVSPWGYGSGLWLGCSDEESEGKWKCDGKPITYKNWLPGKPDNQTAMEDCQQWLADTGQWNDTSCSTALGYICRGDAKLTCTGRKVTAGNTVFCARGDDMQDWDNAKKACAKSGGKLAVLATAEESQALFAALKHPLAIPSAEPAEGLWIGLTDLKDEGKFRWSNDAPMTYGNWLPKQPDDSNGGEDCASLTLGDGRWNDVDCIRALPYLCEAK